MVWAKLDDEILDNEKITRAGVLGFALHVAAITWCCRKLTDGFVPYARVRLLLDLSELDMEYLDATGAPDGTHDSFLDGVHNVGAAQPLRIAERLVTVGLWREDKARGGFWIHDFLEYNPSKEEAESAKAARSSGGKKGAERRWRQTSTMAVAMGPPMGEAIAPPMGIPMAPAWLSDRSGHGSPDGSAMAQRCPDPDPDPVPLSTPTNAGARETGKTETDRPDWFASAIETVEAQTGESLRPAESWLRYSGHRATVGKPKGQQDAVYWLTTVMVPEARKERRDESDKRERQSKWDADRAKQTQQRGGRVPEAPPPQPYHRAYKPPKEERASPEEAAAAMKALTSKLFTGKTGT